MMKRILSVFMAVLLACTGIAVCADQVTRTSSEKPIGNISLGSLAPGAAIAISSDGDRFAYVMRDADGMSALNLDGISGPKYDKIVFPKFSPDGKHFAYTARSGEKWFMVLDGKEGSGYDRLSGLTFSQDGNHSAYAATSENQTFMMIDGKEEEYKFDNITSFMFSLKSDHFAYIGFQGDTQFLVADSIKGPGYDKINLIEFGPDGSHLAYFVKDQFFKKQFVVLDGQKGKEYDVIFIIKGRLFEPEGDLRYVAIRGDEVYLIKTDLTP